MGEQIILNPISNIFKDSIEKATGRIKIAVPFMNSFAKKMICHEKIDRVQDKRLITKFDSENINSFDLPTIEYLLDCGFQICYNNRIHLKLYITDNDMFITSSNLTNGGFENNIELTVRVNSQNFENCEQIFENLWFESKQNEITRDLIKQNWDKYEVLKKRTKFENLKVTEVKENFSVGNLNIQELLDVIFNRKEDYSWILNRNYEANKKRYEIKNEIETKEFDASLYYSPKGHSKRRENLYYEFVYGVESKLAGTGLREAQFKDVFEHASFKSIMDFLIPESVGLSPWNLSDPKELFKFCNGLFDFKIPQYSEAIPIRLASYFYPDYFLPIFKLNHLQMVCDTLRIETDAKTKGERFYAYNVFVKEKMKDMPFDNYIKSSAIYQLKYCVELYKRLESGENFESVLKSYKKQWIINYVNKGKLILESISAMKTSV